MMLILMLMMSMIRTVAGVLKLDPKSTVFRNSCEIFPEHAIFDYQDSA